MGILPPDFRDLTPGGKRKVIAMEDWVTIKTLKAKNPAMSHREIARLIGISHHTVKTALARDEPPGYKRKSPPTRSWIPSAKSSPRWPTSSASAAPASWKSCAPRATQAARPRCISLSGRSEGRDATDLQPYETLPGEQAQFDWSPYTVLIARTAHQGFCLLLHQRLQPLPRLRCGTL